MTVVIGAGPAGLFTAIALARRGHRVTVVDRDPGPPPDGTWDRRGVMQFHHPHGLRNQVLELLTAELPDVRDALLAAGAGYVTLPAEDGRPPRTVGLRARRELVDRVLWAAARAEPGVTLRTGHAETVVPAGGRVAGVRVDGATVDTGLVIDATGRAARFAAEWRAPGEVSSCGIGYVSRQHRLLPGAAPGPMNAPPGLVRTMDGYFVAVFRQERDVFATLLATPVADRRFAGLRFPDVYDAATRAVPGLAAWVDPDRSRPITPPLAGGRLENAYRGQRDAAGRVALPGLLHVGDAVCTTNPTAGRGIAIAALQVRALLDVLGEHPADPAAAAEAFDAWCGAHVRPWYDDQVHIDADLLRRWDGGDVDVTRPLPSDLILEVAAVEPDLMRVAGRYLMMTAPPGALAEIEPRARDVFARGWRPAPHPGPTRAELAALISATSAAGR